LFNSFIIDMLKSWKKWVNILICVNMFFLLFFPILVFWQVDSDVDFLLDRVSFLSDRNDAYTINVRNYGDDDDVSSLLDYNVYLNWVAKKLTNYEPDVPKDLIFVFCNTLLTSPDLVGIGGSYKQMYDPKQSLFMFSLCTNINPDFSQYFPYIFNNDGQYFKKYQFSWFAMNMDTCDPTKSMVSCDLSTHIPDIFQRLINDYVNIKQADVYWLKTKKYWEDDKTSLDDQANAFLQDRFFGTKFCDTEWEVDGECRYPKSLRQMKSYLRKSEKLYNEVEIVDYDQIFNDFQNYTPKYPEDDEINECANEQVFSKNYNIIMCWLYGEEYPMRAFSTLLYNELFFYRLFVTYYSSFIYLDSDLSSAKTIQQWKSIAGINISKMNQHLDWTQKAIWLSLRMLNEMYVSFPLHIWFLLYHEELLTLRKELAKIVTPVYTLFDKLQNAQEKFE